MSERRVYSETVFVDLAERVIERSKSTNPKKIVMYFSTEAQVVEEMNKLLSQGFSVVSDWHDSMLLVRNKFIKIEK